MFSGCPLHYIFFLFVPFIFFFLFIFFLKQQLYSFGLGSEEVRSPDEYAVYLADGIK